MKARLLEFRDIAPEVRLFVLEAVGVDRLDYSPGQFVALTGENAGRRITRAYSLASAPSGARFELCLNRVQDGLLSPFLFSLDPGGELEMRPPLGHFVPRTPFRDSVFVATGTGVVPFRAILQSEAVRASGVAVTLLFGARDEASLLFREEFEALARSWNAFRFWPTLSRPGAGWTGRTGRVQQHLDEALGARLDLDVYVCGLKVMVNDVREYLKLRGFSRQQIVYEKYD